MAHTRRRKTREKARELHEEFVHDPLRDFEGSTAELYVAKAALWMRENLRQILIGVAVAVVVLIGYIFYYVWAESRREANLIAFEKLLDEPVMSAGSGAEQLAVEKLDAYIAEHSGSDAQRRANLYKLQYLEETGDFAEAGRICMDTANDMSTPELKSYFFLRAGFYFEKAEKFAPAQAAYRDAAQFMRDDKSVMKASAWFGEGRMLLRMGQEKEARESIRRILESDSPAMDPIRSAALAYLLANTGAEASSSP